MVKIRTLLDEVIAFLQSKTELAGVDISAGPTGLNDIKDIGIQPPAIIVFVQPDVSDQPNFDGFSPYTNALVTIFTCCSAETPQYAALDSVDLAFVVENLIWTDEALRNYLDSLDADIVEGATPKNANIYPHKIEYGEKVTYDDYYSDFASSYLSLKITIAK